MKLIGSYQNGNYTVSIFDDGTKIRENDLDFFEPNTVESMDIKITNKCDRSCPMCHEDSQKDGKHGDIWSPCFLDKLHPYTELAIGGGNPLEHPDLLPFLIKCKEHKFIPSMTVNQVHFMQNIDYLKELCRSELIYGLGISLVNPSDEFINAVKEFPNAVIHIINGLVTDSDIDKLKNNNLKILILGYKMVRRGISNYNVHSSRIDDNMFYLKNELKNLVDTHSFKCISFDNLALTQLDVKNTLNMSDSEWEMFYMGDDGRSEMTSCSMFIDMVERKFARNSCDMHRYPLMETVEEMYNFLKEVKE